MSLSKKFQEFKFRNPKLLQTTGFFLNVFLWLLFIVVTLLQIYFNVVPFDQALQNTGDVTGIDVNSFFFMGQSPFYHPVLFKIFVDLFDVIFVTSAVVAFWATWVLSQGRNVFEAFILFLTLALPKTRREWGLIIDRNTNRPIEFATLRLYGVEGETRTLVQQSVTDLDGRYRVYLPDRYKDLILEVTASGYQTLEQKVQNETDGIDYYGSELALTTTESTAKPKFSLRQLRIQAKTPTIYLVLILSTIVTIHSTYGLLAAPQPDTVIFLLMYGLAWIWNVSVIRDKGRKIEGRILNKADSKPVNGAFVKLYDLNKQLLTTAVTSSDGLVNFKVEPGHYLAQISRKGVAEDSSQFFEVQVNIKGFFTKSIEVEVEETEAAAESIPNPFGS